MRNLLKFLLFIFGASSLTAATDHGTVAGCEDLNCIKTAFAALVEKVEKNDEESIILKEKNDEEIMVLKEKVEKNDEEIVNLKSKISILENEAVYKVDGSWGDYGSWTDCTRTCGGGTSTRRRLCDSPAPLYGGRECTGSEVEEKTCNNQQCPGQNTLSLINPSNTRLWRAKISQGGPFRPPLIFWGLVP